MSLYLYGFVAAVQEPLGRGMRREPLRAVRCGSLLAIVGDTKTSPARDDLRAVQAHDRIVQRLARRTPAILPARFGTIVGSERELRQSLVGQGRYLRSALTLVRGRVQMTARLIGLEAPADDGPRRRASGNRGAGTRHLLARAAELHGEARAPELDALREAVGRLVRAERVRRGARASQLLTAYHLIDRMSVREYRSRARRVAYAPPVRLAITGPFPPYAFAAEWLE